MIHPIELKNHQQEIYYFRLRLVLSLVFVLIMLLILLGRFFYLQWVRHDYFQTMAESNRIAVVPVVPNRGLIVDRNGIILARNYSAYTLEIATRKVENLAQTIAELSVIIDIQPKDLKRFRKLMAESRNLETLPIRNRLNDTEVARFAAQSYRFPGVEIKARLFREYPYGEGTSHLIGYIGRINEHDMQQLEENETASNYIGSDYIGKTGLEQSYEAELHGTTGFDQVEVDSGGRAVRALSRSAPQSGNTLVLTLDAKLQEIAEQAFGSFRGALVAIDPNNGDVLAFVSKPGYDPNLFVDGIDSENWEALNNSPDVPLNNRPLRGQYPLGSTIKPFMALTGLHYQSRDPSRTISDPGFFTLAGNAHHYRDWKKGGHGTVDMYKSIVISCDTYYYGLAVELGIDRMHDYLDLFGFGKKTGIDMEGESSGLLPSTAWKMKRHKQLWYAGDTVSAGIGQGYMLATPLQLAAATATLANDGHGYRPHFIKQIQRHNQNSPLFQPQANPVVPMLPQDIDLVKRAMEAVTQPGGTAASASAGAEYRLAGKTGTAQVVGMKQGESYDTSKLSEYNRDHAWFLVFAPADKPRIAIAVLAENGGHGGSVAAPIARKVLDYYLLGKLPKPVSAPAATEPETDHD